MRSFHLAIAALVCRGGRIRPMDMQDYGVRRGAGPGDLVVFLHNGTSSGPRV